MTAIKGIIFDLDDTLYDCSYTLTESAQKRAIEAMIDAGLDCSAADAEQAIPALRRGQAGKVNIVEALVERFGPKRDGIIAAGLTAYNAPEACEGIKLFSDVLQTLRQLRQRVKLILVTTGVSARQRNKIKLLGLEGEFDLILIDDIHEKLSKRERFLAAIANYGLAPKEVMAVGDRVFSEIKIGNQLGLVTVQLLHGHYAHVKPSKEWEHPDYQIQQISELASVLNTLEQTRPFRVVLIGGGTGMPGLLSGLKSKQCELTAVVSVTDAGRSSGKLREEFGMAPPGDIRNALAALSAGSDKLTDLLQYRFSEGDLTGHTVGNLLLVALTRLSGSFGTAVQDMAEILSTVGRVLPASLDNLHIQAECEDGTVLMSEQDIVVSNDIPLHERSPIKRVMLDRESTAFTPVLEAIQAADAIILGPGGLYTSVISSLLVGGIKEAINQSDAQLIYVCNLVTQPGQTDNYDSADHIAQINAVLGNRRVEQVIHHNKRLPTKLLEAMERVHSTAVGCDLKRIEQLGATLMRDDIAEELTDIPDLWKKTHLLRHDPAKLAIAVFRCLHRNRAIEKEPV